MINVKGPEIEVSHELVEAVESFPTSKDVNHCGQTFTVSPFEIYATCPACGARIKLRSSSAHMELEDLFDAFFTWLRKPEAGRLVADRQRQIEDD